MFTVYWSSGNIMYYRDAFCVRDTMFNEWTRKGIRWCQRQEKKERDGYRGETKS